MNKTVIILGSSRSKGNTRKIIDFLLDHHPFDVIDLNTKNIGHFHYEFKNKDDDFLPLMMEVIEKYDTIIFATPVYWYAMSGVLKVFFDRFSDLLHYKKEWGRKLRGKNMAMLSSSSGPDNLKEFPAPFISSANYLGMKYLGDVHTWIEGDGTISETLKPKLLDFVNKIVTNETISS